MRVLRCEIGSPNAQRRFEHRDRRPPAARFRLKTLRLAAAFGTVALSAPLAPLAIASDHLDSPATVANPTADIADVYAWTAPERRQLNLVMTIQGHTFSDKVQYVLHIDSGTMSGHTSASTSIVYSFPAANTAECKVGNADSASGDPTSSA